MLKVLVVSHYFWPESFRINQVVNDLSSGGAEVVVLTGFPNYPDGKTFEGYRSWKPMIEDHPNGYEIVRVPVVPRGRSGAFRLFLNYVTFVVSGVLFGSILLRGRRFDVQFVYCTTPVIQGFVGLWFKWLKQAPVVLWVQDIWPRALAATGYIKSPLQLKLIGRAVTALYRGCDLILGQSHSFVRLIAPQAGDTPVEHFPNPGEHPVAAERGERLPAGKFNVVFAGNIGRAQAMDTVLAAAELLSGSSDIQITLFGSGSMSEWTADQVKKRGIENLKLAGRVPPDQMPSIYAESSVLLLPLVDDPDVAETVPSKLQSYFGAGRPIIAAVNGEAARIVRDAGAGLACPAEDPAALADAIKDLRDRSVAEREAMSAAALHYFSEHYEPQRLTRHLLGRLAATASGQVLASAAPYRERTLDA